MIANIRKLAKDEQGQAVTEYGLILGAIAFGTVVLILALKKEIVAIYQGAYNRISNNLPQ